MVNLQSILNINHTCSRHNTCILTKEQNQHPRKLVAHSIKGAMVSRVLEAIFRHPMQLFLMLIVPVVIGVSVAYVLPRSYQSSASLWALRRYEIIGATGPESDLQSTPAETQVAALSELLQSRDFSLAVAKSTNLQSTLQLAST